MCLFLVLLHEYIIIFTIIISLARNHPHHSVEGQPRYFPASSCGRLANTISFLVRHSCAADGEETARTRREPNCKSWIGPCLAESLARDLWSGHLRRERLWFIDEFYVLEHLRPCTEGQKRLGNSGGILCVWDPNSFCKSSYTVSDSFVMVRVMMGDFNEVRKKSERFGSSFNTRAADIFNSFITSAGVEEVPLGGSVYTWCHRSASKMSKLDRPILLRESKFDYGPTPFRFFHHWLEVEGFNNLVIDIDWCFEYRLKVKGESNRLKAKLRKLDDCIDSGKGSEEVVLQRATIVNSLQDIQNRHAMDLAQKAKIKWSVEGDENSRFFHGMINKKRSQLNIRGVMVDGEWVERPDQVKREFVQHFGTRFGQSTCSQIHIDMNFPNVLSADQQAELERPISKVELKTAVWDCGVDKTPGPDGFLSGFYRHFWDTIEADVFDAVNHFFSCADIPKGCNSSFIALILKSPNANMVKDFRHRVVDAGMFKGIQLSTSMNISHMFYADEAGESDRLKAELRKLDDCIDSGKGSEEVVLQRATVV
nr:hypothetical protein [Tanacetum cinerariifolium]